MNGDSTIACPVAAIGASAGGLEALEELFDTLPDDTGMAFVVVTHREPGHESHLAELLSRHSTMPVAEVAEESTTPLQANHVYVIPPDKFLSVSKAGLQAIDPVPKEHVHMPIDRFLNALAESHHNASIAVILSGSGSDGALGLRAIKAQGGLVIAQKPDSAGHDSMPDNAIDTGLVDIVAIPADMPMHMISFLSHSVQASEELTRQDFSDDYTNTIIATLHEPFLVLDKDLVVQSANREFYRTFAVSPDDTRNRRIYTLGNDQWNIPALHTLLEELLPQRRECENFLIEHSFPAIGMRTFLLNARQLEMPHQASARILLAFEDITEREVARDLKRNAETFTRLVDESPFGIYVIDSDFRISRVSKGGQSAFCNVKPLIGRDFTEAIHILWPESLASEIVSLFRRTLETGEPYVAPSLTATRVDLDLVQSYEWQIHRITLPDGAYGVVCYFFDSSDIRAAEQAARESEKLAHHANSAKSDFLAQVSHDIRTPMSAVLGYAELLLNQLTHSDHLQHVEIIKSSGESLLRLVDDLLDLSSIEAGKLHIEPGRCELEILLAETISQVQMHASEKNLNLTLDYAGVIPQSIETDAGRLQQILLNLLSNAIKFTDKGNICLQVRFLDDQVPTVQFVVTDTGIGISESRQKKLFQPYERASRRNSGGTGLGLYISNRLAERLQGTLTVESTLRRGSSFTLEIPVGTSEKVELVEPGKVAVRQKSIAQLASMLVNKHVLIVDDQPAVRNLLQKFVKSANGKVTTASNGQIALDLVDNFPEQSFDAIILDLQMPVMDGFATVRMLRQRGFTAPVIAITADALYTDRQQCLSAGFDAYLNKPVVGHELIKVLHQLMEGKRRQRVLVVDDSAQAADPLSRLLQIKGFEVQTACNGASALAAIDTFAPDVVLLDIGLPDMDGYQLADLIRKLPDSHGITLIVLTGSNSMADQEASHQAGIEHHLVKPVDTEQLLMILRS